MKFMRLVIITSLFALTGCAYLPTGESQRLHSEAPANSTQQTASRQERQQVYYKKQPGQVDPKISPYSVMGKTYWPVQSGLGFKEEGYASWYGIDFHGKKTATGETYDMFSVSAAHKTLPLGTKVRVTNLENGRELELVVNDRGPFVDGRIIDLSYASARLLGMADNGLARVRVVGVEDNPVLATATFKGVAVAANDTPPRKPKGGVIEKDLAEVSSPAPKAKPAQAKAPVVVAKAQPVAEPQAQQAQMFDGVRYSVQVGAFAQDENARRVKDRLVQSGFRGASVVRAVRGGRELSVVQAGSFEAREQAEEVLRAVKDEFPASFINSGVLASAS
ncbi:MAG TPA: septal ring lytic transglycosylase RlpA family protein [Humidesulfovibrio sp.]|uniref:septal ring lytic transglycosylase RlpA family protein n=1 Tax=Humidesulfovibrio sp. TaxID=2910988 RepID=UPI002B790CB3|nr:septal ring lytic transglycosylase RlpA family protein [Humidesulfovibrio sp.]HWR03028.1 septal ring lytic transglycosylase RlpA family protein [Humidesulfovibrio sp.]